MPLLYLSFSYRHDPTSVVLAGGDNISQNPVILSNDSPNTLPIKDLINNTVRIKLDQRKDEQKRSPLKKLQEKLNRHSYWIL